MKGVETIILFQSLALSSAFVVTVNRNKNLKSYHDNSIIKLHANENGKSSSGNSEYRLPDEDVSSPNTHTKLSAMQASSLQTSSSTSLNAGEREDVNDLFAAYMAQRKDMPLSNNKHGKKEVESTEEPSSNTNTLPPSPSPAPVGSRLKKMLTNNGGSSQKQPHYVQPISLGSPSKKAPHSPSPDTSSTTKTTTSSKTSSSTDPPNPPSLLQKSDIDDINKSVESFTKEMQTKLDELQSGDTTISNEFLEKLADEQRNELVQEKTMESWKAYEERRQSEWQQEQQQRLQDFEESQNSSDEVIEKDLIVQEIIHEAEKRYDAEEQDNQKYQAFRDYEESLKNDMKMRQERSKSKSQSLGTSVASEPVQDEKEPTLTFEEMQLNLLEDLLERRNEAAENDGFDDEDIYLTDNIEDGIDELRKIVAAQKDSKNKQIRPDNLKEWQMYRAIATKLANEKKSKSEDDDISEDDVNTIQQKLEAWKEFQKKEQEMREKAGLTIKYKLPFEWSDKPDYDETVEQQTKGPINREEAEKAKSEMDDLALQVLIQLMDKTEDVERKKKLRNEIEALEQGIRARKEYLKKRGPEIVKKKKIVPVTIDEVLRPKTKKPKKKTSEKSSEEEKIKLSEEESFDELDEEEDDYSLYEEDIEDEAPTPPPDSPFFREMTEIEGPPDSPFFSDVEEDSEYDDSDTIENDAGAPSLGSLEEQRFRSLVARSGVRTVEGQNELKQQWEEFQEAEKKMREKAGLSNSGISSSEKDSKVPEPKVNYDVNNLFKEDGDIDFDVILSSIGTRPSRKNNALTQKNPLPDNITPEQKDQTPEPTSLTESVESFGEKQASEATMAREAATEETIDEVKADSNGIINTDEKTPKVETGVRVTKLKKDPNERGSLTFGNDHKREVERKYLSSQFAGFEERKQSLLEFNRLTVSQIDNLIAIKDYPFASGVSPYLAKMNNPFKDFGSVFSLEGVLVDVSGLHYKAWAETAKTYDFVVPLIEDVKFASVHQEEFAIQRIFYWTDDIFAARKIAETFRAKMREIFEEWKESHSTGPDTGTSETDEPKMGFVTDETPEDSSDIEDDILDVQLTAWGRAARAYGYTPPTKDLLNVVGTLEPEQAIRSVFRWTKDFVVSSDVSRSYRKYLKEETEKWLRTKGKDIALDNAKNDQVKTHSPKEENTSKGPTAEDILVLKQKAWETASSNRGFHFTIPTLDEVQVAEFVGIENAIKNVFKWDLSPDIAENILHEYKIVLRKSTQELLSSFQESEILQLDSPPTEDNDLEFELPLFVLKDGVEQWLTALEDIKVPCSLISNMDEDIVDYIIKSLKIESHFPPESRVTFTNGYRSESQQMLGAALRIERRPDHCVAFTSTPQSAVACHEADMKNVAIVSPYPYYELTTSDMTVRNFGAIGVRNLRNVFSENTEEEPMEQIEVEGPQIRKQTMLKTRFWDEGDR